MRGLPALARPSAPFSMLRPDAEARPGTVYSASQARRGLLSSILESVGDFLGFGNNQAHPADPKDTGNGASSTPGSHEPTSVMPPLDHPPPPAQAPPASYPAPGGGGQLDKPTSTAPVSVSSVPPSSSAGNAAEPALHSTSPAAMNAVPTPSTTPPTDESQHVSDIYSGTATSHSVSSVWPSISPPASDAPFPTQSPSPAAQIGRAKQFPLAAAAAIGAVLGFLVVSALFWAVWLSLRKRRRAYPEFGSVHPKRIVSVLASVGNDTNPFTHSRDEKEEDPFEPWRASTARSLASTLSV